MNMSAHNGTPKIKEDNHPCVSPLALWGLLESYNLALNDVSIHIHNFQLTLNTVHFVLLNNLVGGWF